PVSDKSKRGSAPTPEVRRTEGSESAGSHQGFSPAAFLLYKRAAMKRLLALWLTLLGAFWLTRELTSALLFQRVDQGPATWAELLIVPAGQTAVVGWHVRGPRA